MTPDLLLRGDLVLEDRVVADGALAVAEGRIAAVLEPGDELPDAAEVHDLRGRYLMPGVVDTHVHAGSFETEDLTSTTASAAFGGVTTIVDMPYDGAARARSVPADLRVVGEAVGRIRDTEPERVFALSAENLRRALPRIG